MVGIGRLKNAKPASALRSTTRAGVKMGATELEAPEPR